ncbi:hypothetical protein CYCD_24600 [Tenuifilaceae bacterium CYCD]|nr:hypothetical protein CYCD_24600 [Tenuifilaceae bacterium CYCD]
MKNLFYLVCFISLLLFSCEKEKEENKTSTFADTRDGKVYECITVNGKTWFAENFSYQPPVAKSSAFNKNMSEPDIIDYSDGDIHFKLYKWNIISTIIPDGWHLPSEAEYDELIQSLGGYNVAGNKLKAKGVWEGLGKETDEIGFSALPGSIDESGLNQGFLYTHFWTSTSVDDNNAKALTIWYGGPEINITSNSKEKYYCVRFVKNN